MTGKVYCFGNKEAKLGSVESKNKTSVIMNLTQPMTNFQFIMILNSYYDSGYASYAYSIVPTRVALGLFSNDIGLRLPLADDKSACVRFPSSTTIDIVNNTLPGNYFVARGYSLI